MRLSGRKASSYAPRWTPRQSIVLFSLLGANVIGFIAQLLVQSSDPALVSQYLGLSYRGIDQAFGWQFFSAMFLPGSVFQFAANIIVLYVLGRDVESILGQKHFLYLYLLGAVGGELAHLFLMPSTTVLLAAAGGVAAVVVAFGALLPELEIAGSIFFLVPVKLKAKQLSYGLVAIGAVLLLVNRQGVVSHSAYLGGCVAGWFYAQSLGFGPPSFLQRYLRARRLERERLQRMSVEDFIVQEIDPLLDKISRGGLASLTRCERRKLAEAHARMTSTPEEI